MHGYSLEDLARYIIDKIDVSDGPIAIVGPDTTSETIATLMDEMDSPRAAVIVISESPDGSYTTQVAVWECPEEDEIAASALRRVQEVDGMIAIDLQAGPIHFSGNPGSVN